MKCLESDIHISLKLLMWLKMVDNSKNVKDFMNFSWGVVFEVGEKQNWFARQNMTFQHSNNTKSRTWVPFISSLQTWLLHVMCLLLWFIKTGIYIFYLNPFIFIFLSSLVTSQYKVTTKLKKSLLHHKKETKRIEVRNF